MVTSDKNFLYSVVLSNGQYTIIKTRENVEMFAAAIMRGTQMFIDVDGVYVVSRHIVTWKEEYGT